MKPRKQSPATFAPARAPFACFAEMSRGRLYREPPSAMRSEFQRDRDRIVHSTAFRRLKHKTQVFVHHEGDHYRTRLTHSLEVAQIARTVSRALGLDEDLAEAVALAHDLGHTPFGHTGEDALDAAMVGFGGFDHNAQTLRILTKLEHRYAGFDGLNLTWESLEGVVKHNGPLVGPQAVKSGPLPAAIVEYAATHDLWLGTWPGAEAQVASLSDDIAYNNHDVDDGLRAELFSLADLAEVPLVGATLAEVRRLHGEIEASRLIGESIRRLIDRMATDLLDESRRRLDAAAPRSSDDVRRHRGALIAFSDSMLRQMQGLREFLHARMYRHERVNQERESARRVVGALFEAYLEGPERLPPEWRERTDGPRTPKTARLVADYIAGMTDRFAFQDYARVFGERH
ncbi:MAG TPA: deoxyguanosinetriphosphate triphosphohydrolase [Alphaproteobacteria bacterium]|nr:deoxyguanosinetriphosphate triphosphohydrolase [Alphaproteobacteria bacterium]